MNERNTWIGLITGGVLAAGGFGSLIYMKFGDIEGARGQVSKLRTEIKDSRSLVEGTSSLEREVIVLREMATVIDQILPSEDDVYNLVRTINDFADDSNVRYEQYREKSASRRATKSDFDKVAYTYSLEGGIFELMDLMSLIENHQRFISIPSFKISAAARKQAFTGSGAAHRVTLDIETYQYKPRGELKPVRIEGEGRKRDLLTGEINRRRQALELKAYTYRGPRGRRDPFIDPRVPVTENPNALTVQQQMEIVDDLSSRLEGCVAQWTEVVDAPNVLAAMMTRQDLAVMLGHLDEELRRVEAEESISYVPAQKRMTVEVYEPLNALKLELNTGISVLGPSRETLTEVHAAMERHLDLGEYSLALEAFGTVKNDLDLLQGDIAREEWADRLVQLAEDSQTLQDFEAIDVRVGGVAIMDGASRAVIINERSFSIGDMVTPDLEVFDIRVNAIDFIFRGVILTRVF